MMYTITMPIKVPCSASALRNTNSGMITAWNGINMPTIIKMNSSPASSQFWTKLIAPTGGAAVA